jgi:transcriptional regulator with XRE-family HTH domain
MELTTETCAILTPAEMRSLRKLSGMTLDQLGQESRVSKTQLSMFENGKNGLFPEQVLRCEEILLRAARERNQALSRLLA